MKHDQEKRAKDGSGIYNMLYMCYLLLLGPGRMGAGWAERVPGWAERVPRWAEQVPGWAERVPIGREVCSVPVWALSRNASRRHYKRRMPPGGSKQPDGHTTNGESTCEAARRVDNQGASAV